MKSIHLIVTETTQGLWYNVHSEGDAIIMRDLGYSPSFNESTYSKVMPILSALGYSVKIRKE